MEIACLAEDNGIRVQEYALLSQCPLRLRVEVWFTEQEFVECFFGLSAAQPTYPWIQVRAVSDNMHLCPILR